MPEAGTVPLYRLFKTSHFYTTDANEQQNAILALGYQDEGIACHIYSDPSAGPQPLYRSLSSTGSHFYTMSIGERDNATNNLGYKCEGIACYIFVTMQLGQAPFYRAYQKANDDHFYTTDLAEHQHAVQVLGYNDEGITGYVATVNGTGVTPFYRLYGPDAYWVIALMEQYQLQSNWCWSASTVSITQFYDPATIWTQCKLVNQQFKLSSCCVTGGSLVCNQPWYPDKALAETGHFAGSTGPLSLKDLISQLVASHPVSIRIGWIGGGGHNPVITGFDQDAPGGPTIQVQDPIFGTSTQDFNTFPHTYHGGASWTDSFLTK